jgi:two-component system LytT family response regulator
MKTVIIDDEANNVANLQSLLQQYCPIIQIAGVAYNAATGKDLINSTRPELVFLDIQMPGESGFDMLQKLPTLDFELVFVTAYDQYGIQAIKFSAIDYLLKPIRIEELQIAVQKATDKNSLKKQNLQLENLLLFLQQQQNKDEHRIALPTAKETRFVSPHQIIRCESSNNYTYFFLESGEEILVSKPLFEFEPLLENYGFARTHQSHLVNKKYVRSFIKEDGGYLLLENGSHLPVSRLKKEMVKKWYG